MDNESITDEPASLWPEMSSDISSARTVARSITLDTQRASTDGRVLELTSQLQAINARLLELETRVATGLTDADEEQRTDRLEQEVVDLRTLLGETSARVDEAASTPSTDVVATNEAFLALDSRMSAVESGRVRDSDEVNQLMSYLEQAFVRLDELASRLAENEEGLRTKVTDAEAELAAQVGEVRGVLERQVNDVEINLAADVAEARQQLEDQVQQAEQRLTEALDGIDPGASTDTTDALDQRLGDLDARMTALADDASTQQQFADVNAHIATVEGRLHELSDESRLEAMDHRLAEAEGRVNELAASTDSEELGARVDDLTGRVESLTHEGLTRVDERVNEVHGRVDDVISNGLAQLDSRVDDVQTRIDEVAASSGTAELGARVDDLNARVDNSHSRIDEVEERASTAAAELLEQQSGTDERIAQTEARLDAATERLDDLDSGRERIDESIAGEVEAAEFRLAERIAEAREQLASQQETTRAELATQLEESEEALATKIGSIEDELAAQVAEARELLAAQAENGASVQALAALEERIEAIDEQASSATSIAVESQHFAENLRVLQTDLVKAIQVELEGQAVRLGELELATTATREDQASVTEDLDNRLSAAEAGTGTTDARLDHLETTIVSLTSKPGDLGLAPANPLDGQRLSAVETRLDDTAAAEQRLSDIVANLTAALEQTTRDVQSLRAQLDDAHGRIAELEGSSAEPTLTFTTRQQPEAPTPEPVDVTDSNAESPTGGLRVGDVIGETVKEERLTPKDGSDWFVASYAKKDKNKSRFRRP